MKARDIRQFCRLPHGLFWRVFFTIGLAVLLTAMMSFALFSMSAASNIERVYAQDYTGLVSQVRQALDDDALIELQSHFQAEKHAMLVVLEGRQALGTRPPPWVMNKIRRSHRRSSRDGDRRRDDDDHHDHRSFEPLQTRMRHNGRDYRIIILPTISDIRKSAKPLAIALFLAMLVGVSMLIAWMFSRPIRGVQSAARQLSTGDTSARVPERITCRRDSIGELGADFNHMAERIAHLLEAQRQLLRDVSHELRTPLARMQVALVLSQDNPDSAASHLGRIESEIERLNDLIGSILSLSKVESGAATLDQTTFSLAKLLQQITQDAEFEFSHQQLKTYVDCPNFQLHGDREQLRSALENIVRNAMRYSPENGSVEVWAVRNADGVELCVRDHGPGVDEAQLPRLFEAFYRADKARSAEQAGGHGVGLAIARSIVAMHDGSITAANAAGGGLEVTIRLPAGRLR